MKGIEKRLEHATQTLIVWYEGHKRDLPWRCSPPDPYAVWVSEIMLQQTRVEAVRGYYIRWMNTFPTVFDLANADEEAVLKAWEGLGYYSRARNLHKAAKTLVSENDGKLFEDKKRLLGLSGIGEYTAGAILSIAFGEREPAVDGNVLRVFSRLNAEAIDVKDVKVRSYVAESLRPYMKEGKTSSFTQGLFELGALVCIPDTPKCGECPLTASCLAFSQNRQKELPIKAKKKEKKVIDLTVFVISYQGKFAIRKRPDKGLLANLYELPNREGKISEEEVLSLYDGVARPLPDATHVFTHIIWNMKGYLVEVQTLPKEEDLLFVTPEEIKTRYSLPSAFSAFRRYCE